MRHCLCPPLCPSRLADQRGRAVMPRAAMPRAAPLRGTIPISTRAAWTWSGRLRAGAVRPMRSPRRMLRLPRRWPRMWLRAFPHRLHPFLLRAIFGRGYRVSTWPTPRLHGANIRSFVRTVFPNSYRQISTVRIPKQLRMVGCDLRGIPEHVHMGACCTVSSDSFLRRRG